MSISQNVRFVGEAKPGSEREHPPGAPIIRLLESLLPVEGWDVADLDNWRDCGWSAICSREAVRLQIVVVQVEGGQWMLQIAPSVVPGLIGRLFGAGASAEPKDTTELAMCVHRILKGKGSFSGFAWRWDGWPHEDNSTPQPCEAGGVRGSSK